MSGQPRGWSWLLGFALAALALLLLANARQADPALPGRAFVAAHTFPVVACVVAALAGAALMLVASEEDET